MKRGQTHSPEVRARMSEASKRAWANPEVRARMSEAIKRALADPEVRARMSEASKRALAATGKALPPMTPEQRKVYDKLRRLIGRDAALEEILLLRGERREAV